MGAGELTFGSGQVAVPGAPLLVWTIDIAARFSKALLTRAPPIAPPARSSHQGKPEPALPTLSSGLDWLDPPGFGVGVGVDVPKIITRVVSTKLGVADVTRSEETAVCVSGGGNGTGVNVAAGKTKSLLPPCPPPDESGCTGVFVGAGGRGVLLGIGVSEGVTLGGKVALGALVGVGEGVSVGVGVSDIVPVGDGVTPGAGVSVAVGVSVSVTVGEGVIVPVGENVAVGTGVSVAVDEGVTVFVDTGGGGET